MTAQPTSGRASSFPWWRAGAGLVPLAAATVVITIGLLVWHPTLAAGDETVRVVKSGRLFPAAESSMATGSGQR